MTVFGRRLNVRSRQTLAGLIACFVCLVWYQLSLPRHHPLLPRVRLAERTAPCLPTTTPIRPFTLSTSSTPPRFHLLVESSLSKAVVHLPSTFRRFPPYQRPLLAAGLTLHLTERDWGDATRLFGLCSMLDEVEDVAVYVDDHMDYDPAQLAALASLVSPGRVVSGSAAPHSSKKTPPKQEEHTCASNPETLHARDAVAITKTDLRRVCNSAHVWQFTRNRLCFEVADEWLSELYRLVGLRLERIVSLVAAKPRAPLPAHACSYARAQCITAPTPRGNLRDNTLVVALFSSGSAAHRPAIEANHRAFTKRFGHAYEARDLTNPITQRAAIVSEWLGSCFMKRQHLLFLTDDRFLFSGETDLPTMWDDRHVITNFGCAFNRNEMSARTLLVRCSKDLREFVDFWQQMAAVYKDEKIPNGDQLSFNVIRNELAFMLQLENHVWCDPDGAPIPTASATHLTGVRYASHDLVQMALKGR